MEYVIHLLILVNIYVILTTSTNLMVGMLNLLSLGQAAFFGIGAYLSVLALMVFNLSLLPSLLFIMFGTGVVSMVIAFPSIRLKGDYFVLATLGFQLIVFSVLYNWVTVTRGPYGISGIPSPRLVGDILIKGSWQFLVLSTIIAGAVIYLFYKLIHSPFGRVLKGIRDDELSAKALGKNVISIKIQTFAISSAFISIAGYLYASYILYIDPTNFNLDESIFILSALIVGGLGNVRGPVYGAIFIILLPEILRLTELPDSVAANLQQIIYGLTIIIVMRFRPKGIAGNYAIK